MIPLRASYRLQLNKDFRFSDAQALVPYLDQLGISHAYLSPILKARPGSTHGYDTVDHTQVNPELGTIDEFRSLVAALRSHEMGVILDYVPNHMGVGGADNALWLDVLKHGPDSQYADWFDIDWNPPRPGMADKLLVPFLGSSYAEALSNGEIALKADGDGFAVWAYDAEKLPVRDADAARLLELYGSAEAAITALTGQKGHPGSWAALDGLIATQHWRLAHYLAGGDEVNYRRFFINSDLGGIRIDRPDVFDHAHRLIFQLVEEGLVDGLRIDHVDGLLDPKGYLEQLRAKAPRPVYLVIEKILGPHEPIRSDWPVDGTTGYEIGAQLTRVLMRPEAEAPLSDFYAEFVGEPVTPPPAEAYLCKLRVMDHELAVELAALSHRFALLAWTVPQTADFTELGLRRALREVIAQLSVYRTYHDDEGIDPRDAREIRRAVALGKRGQAHIQPAVFDFIEQLLCGTLSSEYDPRDVAAAVGKFQQYTGPVMAKGLEDTALYRYNRLVALNEVGAHPERFSVSVAAFHDSNGQRLAQHPVCMIATSTHDTKRGEDTRALIAAMADAPEVWIAAAKRWRELLSVDGEDPIHPNDLYLFLQLLHGGWPMEGEPGDLAERLKGAMEKSLREARLRSDWGVNNQDYEGTVAAFIDAALANERFLSAFKADRQPLLEIGRRKGLVQAAIKLTIPGMPDIYRGAEDWEQSFVDPDNRRPVDFGALAKRLQAPQAGRDDKLMLTQTLLELRRRQPELFTRGSYEPIEAGESVLAFRRVLGDQVVEVYADLSAGHQAALSVSTDLPTIYGSAAGPVWIVGR